MADKKYVNLDALIPRADLFEETATTTADTPVIRITDLQPGITYDMLRKPDFQRETANWEPWQVAKLVQTFCESDIIPAVILWQNGSQLFVVDGAHRLSALVAWIRDDYGAGELSQKFFQGQIPERQRLMHDQTKKEVEGSVGPWADYKTKNPVVNLKDVRIQWIKDYTAEQAAEAFIRINQGGTVIEPLEERILRAKRSALSIATRVVTRGGTGHPYWQHFDFVPAKTRTPKLGAEIYALLFHPLLQTPIKTMDLPLAGLGYGAGVIRFAFDLVALANSLPVPDSSRSKAQTAPLLDDPNGKQTVSYLQRTKRLIQLILSNHASSLGLHPALYFYTSRGAFQPATLLNVAAWVMDLESRNKLDDFRKTRGVFERLLLAHPVIVKPASHKLGSGARTRSKMVKLLNRALELLAASPSLGNAWKVLKAEFPHLAADEKAQKEEASAGKAGGKFSGATKSAASLAGLSAIPKCPLCGGLKHPNGITLDHKRKKAGGGSSALDNSRWVHPICNSNRDKDEKNAVAASAA